MTTKILPKNIKSNPLFKDTQKAWRITNADFGVDFRVSLFLPIEPLSRTKKNGNYASPLLNTLVSEVTMIYEIVVRKDFFRSVKPRANLIFQIMFGFITVELSI